MFTNTRKPAPDDPLQGFLRELQAAKEQVNLLTRLQRRALRDSVVLYPTPGPHRQMAYTALLLLSFLGRVDRGLVDRPRLFDIVLKRLVKERFALRAADGGFYAAHTEADITSS